MMTMAGFAPQEFLRSNWRRSVVLIAILLALASGCVKRPGVPPRGGRIVMHKVAANETLAGIADDYYGDPSRAKEIAEANGIDEDGLHEGMVLQITMKRKDLEFLEVRKAARVPYNEGLESAARGDYVKAVTKFKDALAVDTRFVDARYNLGVTYQKMKLYKKALEQFEEVVRLRPGNTVYLFALGNSFFHTGRYDKAVDTFEKVIGLDPGHLKAHFSLAASLEKMGDKEAARRAWRRYLELDSSSEWANEARKRLELIER